MDPALVAVCWLIANVNFLKHGVLSVLVLADHTVGKSETSCGAAAASMGTSQVSPNFSGSSGAVLKEKGLG